MTITADAGPVERLQAALSDPEHLFTRDQVLYLMGEAGRWAREAAEDADNAAWPPPPVWDPKWLRWLDQVDYRRRWDAQARQPRPHDHRGGPVPVWEVTPCPA
jgi:hypothetical protein